MSARKERSRQMMEVPGYGSQIAQGVFKIRSQTDPSKHYEVKQDGDKLVCSCPDHFKRNADCKHIHTALEMIKKKRCYANEPVRILERSKLQICKFCDSGNIKKWGTRKNKKGVSQLFKCMDCSKRFTTNFGFEKRQFDEATITGAMQMYFTGMSVRDIADHYEMLGVDVSFKTIYNWVSDYSRMTTRYINGIVPRVGNWFRADEVWVKIAGKRCYLFASMDDDTRYWLASDIADNKFHHNADSLVAMTKKQAGKNPRNFITDGLPAYMKSSKKVFGNDTNHVRHIHLAAKRDKDNNNKMERLNGEIRDREKVFRGLKKMDTAVLDGMRVYYNFTKKHSGIDCMTPAEASLIEVDGKNRWKMIIQNASLHKDNST